jgi:hypothetical protein
MAEVDEPHVIVASDVTDNASVRARRAVKW